MRKRGVANREGGIGMANRGEGLGLRKRGVAEGGIGIEEKRSGQ